MQAWEATTNLPELIAAVGSVFTSALGVYLVHRRLMADRADAQHRVHECAVYKALIDKLQLDIEKLEAAAKPPC